MEPPAPAGGYYGREGVYGPFGMDAPRQRLAYVRPSCSTMAFFRAAGSIAPCLR